MITFSSHNPHPSPKMPLLLSDPNVIGGVDKKIGTLSTEIDPAATKIVKFWPKKAYLSMGT